jgi:hypothetical protein
MIAAVEALARLREGNRRFVDDRTLASTRSDHVHRATLVDGQYSLETGVVSFFDDGAGAD